MQNTKIEIYTDGSCLGNPGPGGWGVIILLVQNGREILLSGGELHTTNNRMEMTAMIGALEWLHGNLMKDEITKSNITIYSDSNLLISTLNLGWKRKANLDLWTELDRLRFGLSINWVWVKAHATNKLNNRVDKLALAAAIKEKNARALAP